MSVHARLPSRSEPFRRYPRIAGAIEAALGDAESIANIGAGAGSYEPRGRRVVAIAPALTMIRQRPHDAAPAVRATATAIPLRDTCVDAVLAVMTIHHWPDRARRLSEMRRVARKRVVILPYEHLSSFWLGAYFPGIWPSAMPICYVSTRWTSATGSSSRS